MKLSDFDYELPEELIALEPTPRRDGSRMMVLPKDGGALAHRGFTDFADYIRPGDLLVLNDTKVIPARIFGRRATGGKVEFLLVEPAETVDVPVPAARRWKVIAAASKKLREGETIDLDGPLAATIEEDYGEGFFKVAFNERPLPLLRDYGHVPLPPYIAGRRAEQETDFGRYQTVYADRPGSCAAPTAGLHFTKPFLDSLRAAGVGVARVTLHVGPGTFLPVRTETIEEHTMYEEAYVVSEKTQAAVDDTRASGGRVVAVGTTGVRTLETIARTGRLSGRTDLFITPGFEFRAVDALLTNFHLPKSTLLMLVSALVGRERLLAAYREAIAERYRFYSYGDCMLIV